MNAKNCEKLYQKGLDKLKTSFFSFKFSPDYVGAVDEFTAAAKGYRQIGNANKSIESYMKAIECNTKLNDHWSAGNCYLSIAEIYFFDSKESEKGLTYLNKASYEYQVSGKFSFAIKSYISTAEKFMESEEDLPIAEKILLQAFDVCCNNVEDKLVGSSFEQIFNKLLDVQCGMKKWVEAIQITQKYIDSMLKFPEKDNYRINKTYMKLCILRIINKEDYLCEDIFIKMINSRYEDTSTDIGDIRKLMDAIKKLNKKEFTFCVSSAFTLFENNLLKGLQDLYKKREESGVKEEDNKGGDNANNINTNPQNAEEEDMC